MENRKINFLKRYEVMQKSKKKLTPGAKRELIIVVVIILLACIGSGLLIYKNIDLRNQIDANYAYLNDPINVEHYNEVLVKDKEISLITSAINDIDKIKETADTFPKFGTDFVTKINSFEQVQINSFTYNVNQVLIKASCHGLNEAPLYVDYLQSTGLFTKIDYYGFEYNKATNLYDYEVLATVKRGNK